MSILIVGSAAYDTVDTPFGRAEKVIGGSALYSSVSASFFHPVNLVTVVGSDFPKKELEFLAHKGIDTSGIEIGRGKTFAWEGSYSYDLNNAKTHKTALNVFEHFNPQLPDHYKESEYVFLGNIDPELQLNVLDQVKSPKFTAVDTMNFWIENKKNTLKKVFSKVDMVVINEGEARQFTDEFNLVKAAKEISKIGPAYIIIKRGEYGVLLFHNEQIFSLPAFPLEIVKDPTGAGDSFAGGFMGYLAKLGGEINHQSIRKAIVIGTIMASINVEDFSLERFKVIDTGTIAARLNEFRSVLHFDEINHKEL
ncbi:MAG: PfkB family carbohydrate kinase [Elusimicrobiota bacterium]